MQDISRRDIEITVIVILILLASLVGFFAFRQHKAAPVHTALSGAYKGWRTDNASIRGLRFNYPPTWTDVNSHSMCTGALLVTLTPTVNEINAAKTGPQYYIEIEKFGTESSHCTQDGTNLQGESFATITSSDQLKSGLFKGDWLTFFSGNNSTYTATKADTAVITPDAYNSSQTAFGTDTLSYKNTEYQVSIETSTTEDQTETPSTIDVPAFKATQLYQDTLNIFNSIQKN